MTHAALSPSLRLLALHGGAPVSAEPIPMIAVDITDDDIAAVVRTLRSGMLCQGPQVTAFEERFAQLTGARHAVACANGTCALQLAYELLFESGDEVLCPGWTYIATCSMISARGATPLFCDADARTYNLDLADACAKITPRTRAIAITHLYGAPANIDAIDTFATEHGLRVIYDAAQAHLATYRGRGLGAFGDAVTYSFYATKNMTTGEGGMVTVNDDDLARRLRLLRSHGEASKYTHQSIGFNYRMSDVEAALGLSQLDRLAAATRRRRANAARLDAMIGAIPGLIAPIVTPGAEHVYHLYAVRLELERFTCDRDAFAEALRAEGVGCAVHYPAPVNRQPVFAPVMGEPLPVCDRLASSLLCVPVQPKLSDEQLDRIGEALAKVAGAFAA